MSLLDFDTKTDLYGVMGNPIGHSKSPFIHAQFARQTKQNMEYHAIQVDPGGFDQAVGNFQANGGKGLNITVPFKQEAWLLVDQRSPAAETAGAVNTISMDNSGNLLGDNTDGIGLVTDLIHNLKLELKQTQILVLGAGGAVRGVLAPLLAQNPSLLVVANRTREKAKKLAELFQTYGPIQASGFDDIPRKTYDLIINGTAASLHASVPAIPGDIIGENSLCYDMMYAKEPTVFMRWCAEQGSLRQSDGLGMLVEQAAESFFIWRGVRPQTQAVMDAIRQGT